MYGKYQSSVLLAFVRGVHRWPLDSPHKGPATQKCFHLMTSSWKFYYTAPAHISVASQECLCALFHRPLECLFTSLCGYQQRNHQSSESQAHCVIPIGNNKTWSNTQYCGKRVVALTASWYAYNLENNKAWDLADPVSFKECADDMYLYANSLIISIVVWDHLSCCSYTGSQLLTRINVNPSMDKSLYPL